jgi:hypothetical protein
MPEPKRTLSLDLFRGIALVIMLFAKDLSIPGVAAWTYNENDCFTGWTLSGLIFPVFLFLAGMSVPLSLDRLRLSSRDNRPLIRHILIRSFGLLIIGVLMINTTRIEPVLTGLSMNLWALLMYIGIFLTWNDYKENGKNYFTVLNLKLIGMALLTFLVFKFKSGLPENEGSIITGTWGIPGMIGWGYLIVAFAYLLLKDNFLFTGLAFIFFLGLSILSNIEMLSLPDPVRPVLGVILDGNVPMIMMAGVSTTLIIKKYTSDQKGLLLSILSIGTLSIISGFVLYKWIMTNGSGTTSWSLVCIGLIMILYATVHYITEIRGFPSWTKLVLPAGENPLTTYLAPAIIYHLIWLTGLPVFFYKNTAEPVLAIAGSALWAFLMTGLAVLLVKKGIRVRL